MLMEKKMALNQNVKILGYSTPTYTSGKRSLISYYVRDLLDSDKMVRKQIRLDYIKDEVQRTRYARKLCKELELKLYDGWHPDLDKEHLSYVSLEQGIEEYLRIKEKEYKHGHIRWDSIKSTRSMIGIFGRWLKKKRYHKMALPSFSKRHAGEYMDYIYLEKDVSPTTYNNYLSYCNMFWNFFMSRDYCHKSPFKFIKRKKKAQKSMRLALSKDERKVVREYWEEHNQYFLLCILIIFHCGIRRTELTKIKIEDIDMSKQVIRVPHYAAKTGRERYATMTQEVIFKLLELNILNKPTNYFLIGNKWEPSNVAIKPKRLSDTWTYTRDKIGLKKHIDLYSVRKTGAIQKAEDNLSVQALKDFLGHSDIQAASYYLENHRFKGNQEIIDKSSDF